jgi:hypothetical protein
MDNITDPPIPEMYSSTVMYKITTEQYLRVVTQVVKDTGESKRRFRTIFERAHVYLKDNKNPSIYGLLLEDVYAPRSMITIASILRKRGIIDEDGFFTRKFHTAYYWKYQHMYRVRDVLIGV